MDRNTLRKVQMVQLDIAKEIKRVCEENDIKYHLDSGSLLGAVRHKGFIPWDDDMDFGMLREDYEKFLLIAQSELGEGYFLQTWKTDSNYPYAFAKIRKLGTVFQETAMINSSAHNEVFVDIFPYDSFPDEKKCQRKQGRKIMLYRFAILTKRKAAPWLNHSKPFERFLVRCKYMPAMIFSKFHDTEEMIERVEKIMTMYNGSSTEKYYPQGSSKYGKWLINSKVFTEHIQLPFEDTTFLVPNNYCEYLTEVYGDYMKLPPMDKRENHHHIIELKL